MARDLGRGMTGQDVRVLQDRLNFHLRRELPLVLDGVFGPLTQKRVIKFQTVNGLKADGIVGFRTNGLLFETEVVAAQVLVVPELTLPPIRPPIGRGIAPPRLIPPLTPPSFLPPLPTLTPPVALGPQLTLGGTASVPFTPVKQPSLLNLTFTLTPMKDPTDPVVQSTQNIVAIVSKIPVNSKFKASILSLIPNPIKKIGEPKAGFDLDIPLPKYSPLDPNKASQSGTAKYNLLITGRPGGSAPLVMLQGRAEGKFEIEYVGRAQSTYFKASLEANFFLGVVGVF